MASLNYDDSIVFILLALTGNLSPSQTDIVRFDGSLQQSFDVKLRQIMSEEGLANDVRTRSLVLGCRPHVPGNTPAVQLRNACRFVLRAQSALGGPGAAAVTSIIATVRVAKKRSARPKTAAKSAAVKRTSRRSGARRR